MVASRLTKQRKRERSETRKPHDIITSPDHAHDSAASRKTLQTHTASHATDTHTHTRAHTQTHTLARSP